VLAVFVRRFIENSVELGKGILIQVVIWQA
jgi:hypothetical protein